MSTVGRVCQFCGKAFKYPYLLRRHLTAKRKCVPAFAGGGEDEKKPHECHYCGKRYTEETNLYRHIRTSCKIAPNKKNGTEGMDRLFDLVSLQQEIMDDQRARIDALAENVHALTLAVNRNGKVAINQGDGNINLIDNSTVNIQINVFGRENLDHVTRGQIYEIIEPLKLRSLPDAAVQAVLSAAMLAYSDPEHPENLTCYLPNKKTKDVLVHGGAGWEVKPVQLVLPPMMQRSVDLLFDRQPISGVDGTPEDADNEACASIMKELQEFEKDPKKARQVAGPDGTLRVVLVRNKDQLARILEKLPVAGTE